MTKEQNIRRIREACIRANPSIAELKPHCKINYVYRKKEYGGIVTGRFKNDTHGLAIVNDESGEPDGVLIKWITEIIGRPIRLADVLYAIEYSNKHVELLTLASSLSIYVKDKHTHWNLLKDDLEEQSDETLEFIGKLLSHD